MKADRQIKVLLALIAAALFLNGLNPWLRPAPVLAATTQADLPAMETYLKNMDTYLADVERDVERLVQVFETSPEAGQAVCEWSLICDGPTPGLGRNGEINMNPDWEAISQAGWMLKAVHNDEFVFERCH